MAGPSVVVRVLGDLSNLGKAFGDAAGVAQNAAGKMHSAFQGTLNALNQSGVLGPFSGILQGVSNALDQVAQHGKNVPAAMLGIGGALAGIGAGLSAMGSKDQAAHQQLQAAVEATGKSYDDYGKQVDEAIKHQEKYGHTANETQDALRILTQATNDPAKALQYIGTAADLAAAKHESLDTAAQQLGKTYNGSTRLLKEFGEQAGPKLTTVLKGQETAQKAAEAAATAADKAHQHLADTELLLQGKTHLTVSEQISLRNAHDAVVAADQKAADAHSKLADASAGAAAASNNHTNAIDKVAEHLKGQASAQADTFMGKLDGMKAKIEDSIAQFGQKYGPAITAAGTAMAGLGGAMEALKAIQAVLTAETWAAMLPYLAIAAAILALIAIGYLLYTNWNTIWKFIKGIVMDVWNWIKDNWPLLVAILFGPIGIVVDLVVKNFHTIKDTIVGVWNDIVNFFTGLPTDIKHIFEDIWGGIEDAFKDVINGVIDVWNMLHFTLPKVDILGVHIGGEKIGVPQIPHLAQGGIVTQPTLALLGEAGPEVVTPLGKAGPVMVIEQAQFNEPVDVDLLSKQLAFALSAGQPI